MSLEHVNYSPVLTASLVRAGRFEPSPFFLVDIGCSGGIDLHWRCFGNQLAAAAFDPLERECERLANMETAPLVRYVAAWVGWPEYKDYLPDGVTPEVWRARNMTQFTRTSIPRAQELLGRDGNVGLPEVDHTGPRSQVFTSIDRYAAEQGIDRIDFIKIDTDGSELEVLLGAEESLRNRGVIGVQFETQFHGSPNPYANTAANIDRLLKEHGFMLFDLDIYRVSRSCLPDAFRWDAVGVTRRGQPSWGESLYLRDLAWEPQPNVRFEPGDDQLLKLLCAFEIYGLSDCAVELLLNRRDRFEPLLDVDEALDMLTASWWPGQRYREIVQAFEAGPLQFIQSGAYGGRATAAPGELAPGFRDSKVSLYGFGHYGRQLLSLYRGRLSRRAAAALKGRTKRG